MTRDPQHDLDVSVIIPALEATPHVLNVVSLLAAGDQAFSFEVLLVLNHAPTVIAFEPPPRVGILFCETPGSFAARNAGISAARGKVLAFTDSDVTPNANWMREGYQAAATTDFNMLVGGAIRMFHEKRTAASVYDGGLYLQQEHYAEAGFAATANLWVPAKVFAEVGLFRPELHANGDSEFCRRAQSRGFHLVFCESAIVYHPARWRLGDLLTKERRLAGGLYARQTSTSGTASISEWRILAARLKAIKGSIPFSRRLPVYAVAIAVAGARAFERLRLKAGKSAERR